MGLPPNLQPFGSKLSYFLNILLEILPRFLLYVKHFSGQKTIFFWYYPSFLTHLFIFLQFFLHLF